MSIWRTIPHRVHSHTGLTAFYVNGMLRSLVFALVGIFTPVFIYLQGMVRYDDIRYAIGGVALFYLVTRLTVLLTALPVSKIIEQIGFRRSVFVSIVLLGMYLTCLRMGAETAWLLVLAPILGGMSVPWYWIARDSVVSQDGRRERVGKQVGWMITLEQVTTILGPLSAGFIIAEFGFATLYALALAILCLSAIPLLHMSHHTHRNGASMLGFLYWIKDRRYFHQAVGVAGRAMDEYALSIVWPLTIYLMGWHTSSMGGLFSLVSLVSIGVRLLSTTWFDRLRKRSDLSDEIVYATSSVATSMVWLGRSMITGVRSIFSLDLVGAIFGTLYGSMFVNYEHLGGMRMGSIAYWVYREMIYSLSAIGFMGVMIVGAVYGVWRETLFVMTSLWMLLGIVQARESNL